MTLDPFITGGRRRAQTPRRHAVGRPRAPCGPPRARHASGDAGPVPGARARSVGHPTRARFVGCPGDTRSRARCVGRPRAPCRPPHARDASGARATLARVLPGTGRPSIGRATLAPRMAPASAPACAAVRAQRRAPAQAQRWPTARPGVAHPSVGSPRAPQRRARGAGRRSPVRAQPRAPRAPSVERRAAGRHKALRRAPAQAQHRPPACAPASGARARPAGAACTTTARSPSAPGASRMLTGRRARDRSTRAAQRSPRRGETLAGRFHCTRGATQPARGHPLCGVSYKPPVGLQACMLFRRVIGHPLEPRRCYAERRPDAQ